MEGSAITFIAATAAGSSNDAIVNHQWTFGDGQSDEGEGAREVQHMYAQSGDYQVCLTVFDSDSTTSSCIDVNIGEVSPIPIFELPSEGLVQGQSAVFDARDSLPGGLTDPIDRYNWKFTSLDNPDEAPDFLQSLGALTSVNYTFKSDGRYLVELTVWDTDSSAVTSREVIVEDAVPVVGIRAFYSRPEETVFEGESIMLGAGIFGAGADADPIVQYIWDFGDGNQITQSADAEGRMPTGQNYAWGDEGNGTFIVNLTVVDIDGSQATAQTLVTVLNVAPEMQFYATEDRIELGQALQFAMVHESEPPEFNGPTVVAVVEDTFADFVGTEGVWTVDGIEFNPTIPMTFDAMGEKVIRCMLSDGDGGQTESATTITVTPAAPQFESLETQNGTEGEALTFSLRVNAPVIGVDMYGDVALDILEQPVGSNVTTNTQSDGVIISFAWTPGFYDSGSHRLWLRAGQGESSRERTVDIRISDNGRPLAVALGGSSARGTVSLFEFNETDGAVTLDPTDQLIDVGLGAGDMVHNEDSGYLFVTVPGSNRVAVIDLRGNGTLIRRIPVGTRPTGIVSGGGKVWVISHGDNTIAAIDPNTLKVVATVPLNGLESPTDLVWLEDGFDGLDGAHIAVVAAGNGSVGLVDPERVMQFVTPVEYAVQIGGLLTNIEANPVTNTLEISDETTRRVYSIAPSDLTDAFDGSNSESYAITFAARDLMVRNGVTWVAQGDALLNISDDGIDVLDFTSGSVLSTVDSDITSESLMLLFGSNRIKVYEVNEDLSLDLISDVPSNPVRKMLTLIAPAL
jgi:YVTN family beta-propeller protein